MVIFTRVIKWFCVLLFAFSLVALIGAIAVGAPFFMWALLTLTNAINAVIWHRDVRVEIRSRDARLAMDARIDREEARMSTPDL